MIASKSESYLYIRAAGLVLCLLLFLALLYAIATPAPRDELARHPSNDTPPIAILNPKIDIGPTEPMQAFPVSLRLANKSANSITIPALKTSCDCSSLTDLPRSIPPGETAELRAHITFPRSETLDAPFETPVSVQFAWTPHGEWLVRGLLRMRILGLPPLVDLGEYFQDELGTEASATSIRVRVNPAWELTGCDSTDGSLLVLARDTKQLNEFDITVRLQTPKGIGT